MSRKLLLSKNINDDLLNNIKEIIPNWEIVISKDKEDWKKEMVDAEIIAGWRNKMVNYLPQKENNLRWIQSWSAGVDGYPVKKFAEKQIQLTTASGVHGFPISETIFAMMLSLTRNLHRYLRNQTQKKWFHENIHLELHKKTIGIIGMGEIGKETAKIAKAFQMHVIGVRNSNKKESNVDEMFSQASLHDVLPKCDYVVITLPLTKETYQLFGKQELSLMKPTSFLINIARGEIVDENALIDALRDKKIAGAGLDVFEQEPLPAKSSLWDMEEVIIAPHTAGATEHYDERLVNDIFIPNLKAYLKNGKPCKNVVNFDKGY